MITVLQTPPDLSFCGNPSNFKVISDNFCSNVGMKTTFTLRITGAEGHEGQNLTFIFPDRNIVFTTSNTPDDSGYQIQTEGNGSHSEIFADNIFDCLVSNFEFSAMYSVIKQYQPGTYDLWFEELVPGTTNEASVSTNIDSIRYLPATSAITPEYREGFCVMGGLWDSQLKQLALDLKPVDEAGMVWFDFSEYLTVLSEYNPGPKFTYPFDPTSNVQLFNNYVLKYHAGFAERYSGIIRKIHFTDLLTVLPGGLNRETLVYYNLKNTDFFTLKGNQQSFMTWAPMDKMTGKTTPEKLFFYVGTNPGYNMALLLIKVFFTDGTFADGPCSEIGIIANNVIECSIGYTQLDLGSIEPTKQISHWEMYLYSDGYGTISETRTFRLDQVEHETERVFMFQNSFGKAYDVVRFTGTGSTEIKIEASLSSSVTSDPATSFNAPSRRFDTTEGQLMKTNSGWVTREIKDWFRELLLSKEVYEYKDNLLYPVIIANESIKEHLIDDQYLYSLDLEYQRAYRDFFFSKLPVIIPVLSRNYCSAYSSAYS